MPSKPDRPPKPSAPGRDGTARDATFEHDGLRFELTAAGPVDGEVVVLLHGFPQTRACWDGVIPRLVDAGYRVLAPDQRGYSPGARPRGRRAYRLELLTGDVVALLDAHDVARAHVIGHDWGGAVAWSLAARHPDRLLTMTSLATPHPRAMAQSLWTSDQLLRSAYVAAAQVPVLPELAMRTVGAGLLRRTLLRSGLRADEWDRYRERLSEPGAMTAALSWYRALPFGSPADASPSPVPTLYVYGTADFALGPRAAALTAGHVTGPYRFEPLEGVSHWIPEREPNLVADLFVAHAAAHAADVVGATTGG